MSHNGQSQDRSRIAEDTTLPEGWHRPLPEHLPPRTYWPAVTALGVMFVLWGIIVSRIVLVVGLVLLALGIGGWIGDLRHEQSEQS